MKIRKKLSVVFPEQVKWIPRFPENDFRVAMQERKILYSAMDRKYQTPGMV